MIQILIVVDCMATAQNGKGSYSFLLRKYEWMKRLGLDKENVSEVGSVCSRHFDLKQYSSTKRIRLTKTAVPTATYSNGQVS